MKNSMETYRGSEHFRLDKVAEGIFAAISVPGTGSVGNAAIIDLGDSTLIVDSFQTIQAAEDLKAAAMDLTGNPATYVLNTHWHSDHTSGNQVFMSTAQIISTSMTRTIMDSFGRNRLKQQLESPEPMYQALEETKQKLRIETNEKIKQEMEWELLSDYAYMNMLPDMVYTLPTITFEQQMRIHGKDRDVQILSFGGGHTQSDAFVYIPEEKIAVMGDLVLSKHHPVLAFGNPEEWLSILDRVDQMDIDTIIPGHGEVCSKKELYDVKRYIRDITELVNESIRCKTRIDDILVPHAYQDWYFTTYFKSNLKRIYDLTQVSN